MRKYPHSRGFNIDKDVGLHYSNSLKNGKGNFQTMIKQIFAFIMVIFFCSSIALAATPANHKNQKKVQKQDGSCNIIEVDNDQFQLLAADQTRTRNPKKDGSCKTSLTEDEGLIISAGQTQTRDRKQKDPKRDGSCG